MGQSLADTAVSGMSTKSILAEQVRPFLETGDIEGLQAFRRSQFGGLQMMAKEDDSDDIEDSDEDPDEDDDTEDDEDEDDDDGEGKSKKLDPKDVRIKDLSAEAKRYRLRASSRGKRIRELEAENEALKKGKPKQKTKTDEDDSEKDEFSEDLAKVQKENETLARQNEDLLVRLDFMANTKYDWVNAKTALKLLDLDDVEITEDGEVEGLEEAIDDLAKEHPYLLKKEKDGDDEEDDPTKKRKRSTGQPTGNRKKGTPNREALIKKYNMSR